MAESKIFLGKWHTAFMWDIFKYILIYLINLFNFQHSSTVIREQTLHDFNTFRP